MNKELKNKKTQLSIPCHWSKEIIEEILSQKPRLQNIELKEVYGALAHGGPIGHGRSRTAVGQVSENNAVSFVKFLHSKGLKFTYLLNAPFKFNQDKNLLKKVNQYLFWILEELKPDALSISSHELMRYVRKIDNEIPIYISTIAGVKTVEDLKRFIDIKPIRVIPHHDVGKEWKNLKKIVEFSQKNGIEVELMVTESCLYQCPNREKHYEYLSKENQDAPFHLVCNARKFILPREFLLAGGIIRPEDLSFYEEMGIRHFKITGRSKPANWLPEVVNAYQQRRYKGNLIRLLGIDPSLKAEEWFFIDNQALNGFLKNFPRTNNLDAKIKYCEKWAIKLYLQKKLYALDGSYYLVDEKNNSLKLIGQGGKKISFIIKNELSQSKF